jgi:hypothetical protein
MSLHSLSSPLSNILATLPSTLQKQIGAGERYKLPARCFIQRPLDTGTFILPLKQSFIRDARLMPGTRCMLALLAGWAGQGRALELTEGTIADQIGRSVRQVYRYLQDAAREGYLRYSYTKNRLGMITGLKIWLSFDLIRGGRSTNLKKPENPVQTPASDNNKNYIYNNYKDPELDKKLDQLRSLIE